MNSFLMVPVHLDALMVLEPTKIITALAEFTGMPYFTGEFDANADTAYISENFVSEPFENLSLVLHPGVHLHWSLPDALTRGQQIPGEAHLDFPAVPNRWLITRFSKGTNKNWIVESDYLYPADGAGMNQGLADGAISYPIHSDPTRTDPPFRFMGRAWLLEDWPGEQQEGEYLPKLTAVGYGEPTFAALYSNCRSVFGFHDPEWPLDQDTTYSVVGWYRDSKLDPCSAGLSPTDLNSRYGWHLPEATSDAPERLLCWAVEPLRFAATAGQEPLAAQVEVTVGNTATEALSAYLSHHFTDENSQRRTLEDQLEALNLLPLLQHRQVDLGPKFEEARHEKGFEAVDGGVIWVVRPVSSGGNPAAPSQIPGDVNLPFDLAHRLDDLNQVQQERDQAIFVLQSWRERLYSDWYRYMLSSFPPPGEQGDYPEPDRVRHFIRTHDLSRFGEQTLKVQRLEVRVKDLLDDMARRLPELQLATMTDISSWVELARQISGRNEAALAPLKTLLARIGSNGSDDLHRKALEALNNLIEHPLLYQALPFPGTPPAEAQQLLNQAHQAGSWERAMTLRYNRLLFQTLFPALARQARYELHRTAAPRFWQPREPVLLLVGPGLEPSDRHGGRTRIECALLSLEGEPPANWPSLSQWLVQQSNTDLNRNTAKQDESSSPTPSVMVVKVDRDESVTIEARNFPPGEDCIVLINSMGTHGVDGYPVDSHNSVDGNFSITCTIPEPFKTDRHLDIRVESPSGQSAYNWFTIAGNLPWNPIFLEWRVELFPTGDPDPANQIHPSSGGYAPDYLNRNYWLGEQSVDLAPRSSRKEVKGLCLYSGRGLVTAQAAPLLRRQIEDYLAQMLPIQYYDIHNVSEAERGQKYFSDHRDEILQWYQASDQRDPFLDTLVSITHYLDQGVHALSQTFSGFNAALLGHKQTMQMPVQSPLAFPEDRPFVEAMNAAIGDQNRVAPQPQNDFTPVRSGVLKIVRLRLVNSFGQVWEINPEDVRATDVMSLPEESAQMLSQDGSSSPEKRKGVILPPRLVQPARLDWNWLAAQGDGMEMNSHPATSPVCGWLVPNNLDNSIEVYNAAGQPLGSLNIRDAWWPAPKAETSVFDPINIPNPHLRQVVLWLHEHAQANQGRGLDDFITALDSAQENIDPDGFAQHEGLALLMGRPLAVVRASLGLELRGLPADDQDWNIFRQELASGIHDSAGIETLCVPVRLGERRQLNDGLVGYWLEDEREALSGLFYAPQSDFMQSGIVLTYDGDETAHDPRLTHVLVTLAGPPQRLTLLMDPRGVIHATSGLLPTVALSLPGDQYASVLNSIEVSFFSTPVLQSQPQDPASPQVRLPLPTEEGYAWSWIERNKDHTYLEVTNMGPVERQAKFNGRLTVREGWLRLRPRGASQVGNTTTADGADGTSASDR